MNRSIRRASLAFMILVGWAAFVYRTAPNQRVRWREALPGAVGAAVLWLAVSVGFSVAVPILADRDRVLEALGGVLLLLLWLYLLSLVTLVGGELNAALAARRDGAAR